MGEKVKHCSYCGGTGYRRYNSTDGGRCRPCGGKRTAPLPERQPFKRPPPAPEAARASAKNAMATAGELFRRLDAGTPFAPGTTPGEVYRVVGLGLAETVFDPVFERAIARARARVPEAHRAAFERGLAEGVRLLAERYHGIKWAGG